MTKLPKDLEALRDNITIDETRWAGNVKQAFFNQGFTAGATAVLESEQVKKLVEALEYVSDASCDNALAEYRAWKGQSHD